MNMSTISLVLVLLSMYVMSRLDTLTIACWNSRGYLSSIPYLRHLLSENMIVATSEHWLHKNRLNVLDDVSHTHNFHAKSSKFSLPETYGSSRGQGGVAIFWNRELTGVSVISSISHDRICGINVQLSDGVKLSILSFYLPAVGGEYSFPNCLDELTSIVEYLSEESIVLVCGDFNADVGSGGGSKGPTAAH